MITLHELVSWEPPLLVKLPFTVRVDELVIVPLFTSLFVTDSGPELFKLELPSMVSCPELMVNVPLFVIDELLSKLLSTVIVPELLKVTVPPLFVNCPETVIVPSLIKSPPLVNELLVDALALA